jgi:hypothetical protein
MDGRLRATVANAKQVVGGPLPRAIHAGVDRAERFELPAWKRQTQDRSGNSTQQSSEGDVGLAHRHRAQT